MVIELRGVEFHNKGAELMLHAILGRIRKEMPDTIFVMEKRASAPLKKQREVGIYTKVRVSKSRFGLSSAGVLVPKSIRRRFKLILEQEIEVVLDGSGFVFGDFWGAAKAGQRLADHIQQWKKDGKKVILLPQAFGKFNDVALKKKMEIILNHADLIFARDRYSFDYLKSIEATQERVFLKPDFTNLIQGVHPANFINYQGMVAIIPNHKLVESKVFKNRHDYLTFLHTLTDLVLKTGKIPFFLIHEGLKDLQLAQDVNLKFKKAIKIVQEDNPLQVKGIIGGSAAVVTSRFHGLVSALSQGVPCLCLGWSHKYSALMEDYNYAIGIITPEDLTLARLTAKVDLIANEESVNYYKDVLKAASTKQKILSEEMWRKVFLTLTPEHAK